MSPFLTPRALADRYSVSVKSVYRIVERDDTFPRLKLPGGTLRFPVAALERWERGRSEGIRSPLYLAAKTRTSEAPVAHAAPVALNGAARLGPVTPRSGRAARSATPLPDHTGAQESGRLSGAEALPQASASRGGEAGGEAGG